MLNNFNAEISPVIYESMTAGVVFGIIITIKQNIIYGRHKGRKTQQRS